MRFHRFRGFGEHQYKLAAAVISCAVAAILTGLGSRQEAQIVLPGWAFGCWELELGETWVPDFSERENDIESRTPPQRFNLSEFPECLGEGWFRILPVRGTPPTTHPFAYWEPIGQDSVKLVWAGFFGGVYLRLEVRGDGLYGRAYTYDDLVDSPTHHTSAVARRIRCGFRTRSG